MSKIRVSEIFRSVQGEGHRTGVLSVWVRLFGCNLRCAGFMTENPVDEANKEKQLTFVNPKDYTSIFDLPVIPFGCDSLYAIDARFKHLATDFKDAASLVDTIKPLLYDNKWVHPLTHNSIDLCFTGGEPLMQQGAIIEILKECGVENWKHHKTGPFHYGDTAPKEIQFETNGTSKLKPEFVDFLNANPINVHWNISPKLHNVSGEKDAINIENIVSYSKATFTKSGCLKFVVNEREECWTELHSIVAKLREAGCEFPIYIMPVGATKEQQSDEKVLAAIANRAIENGYHVSGRLHAILFGNTAGV